MKIRAKLVQLLPAIIMAFGCFLGMARAKEAPFYTISSPDHPRAWFVSSDFDKLDQSLRWNESDRSLDLDITYTLQGTWPIKDDPDLYNGFTVRFPAVRLDPVSRELYFISAPGRRTSIGSIQSSFFGERVLLDRNVEVKASRHNGVIDAALVIYPPR